MTDILEGTSQFPGHFLRSYAAPNLGTKMRRRRRVVDFVWNGINVFSLAAILAALIWADGAGPQSWRSSHFVEWEVSKARHPQLLDGISVTRIAESEKDDLWTPPKKGWTACKAPSSRSSLGLQTEGYLQVFLEGGLNQQRMGVCDAVAVAKLLNVTLVLPHLDQNPVWQDTSTFADIFDLNYFMRSLATDVHVVTELPAEFGWSTREYYATGFRATRIKDAPAHAGLSWYQTRVLTVIRSYGIAAIAPFTHRLGFEGLPPQILKLRCRVNFEALRFKPTIRSLGSLIVGRLHGSTPWSVPGIDLGGTEKAGEEGVTIGDRLPRKYLALHLRFDKDMAAHSGCDFGGGIAEQRALSKYRRVHWPTRVPNKLYKNDEIRDLGKCPLTPEEVGIMLAGLGFPANSVLYLASHKVYGGGERMAHLRALFPLMLDKYSLTTDTEIQPFKGKASQLAALDYHVSFHSDAFMSASRGNMHNALVGHRGYAHEGITIRPDMVLLAQLFGNKSMSWNEFQENLVAGHRNRMGQLNLRTSLQSIYTYPAPDCMCALGLD